MSTETEEQSWFEQGVEDCKTYYNSQYFSSGSRYIDPETAIKLFFANDQEQMLQVSRPLSRSRQKWIAGFRKQQITELAQLVVNKRKENAEKE